MVTEEAEVGQRRYVRRVLSPVFPANVEPQPDDLLDIEEWDGAAWRQIGQISHAELTGLRD